MQTQNAKPDSALTSAKKMADIAGLPWSEVQPIYRALQETDETLTAWLPKSQGRAVFLAHPNYIARLLIALGSFADAKSAHAVVTRAQELTLNGRKKYLSELPGVASRSPIEDIFARILTNPSEADKLQDIEFHPDTPRIIFRWKDETENVFICPNEMPVERARFITKRGLMRCEMFRLLSRSIEWRTGPCPVDFSIASEGEDQ